MKLDQTEKATIRSRLEQSRDYSYPAGRVTPTSDDGGGLGRDLRCRENAEGSQARAYFGDIPVHFAVKS